MTDAISDLELGEIVPALRSVYVDTDGISNELAVERLLTRCDENVADDLGWYLSVFSQLEDRSHCAFAVEAFNSLLTSSALRGDSPSQRAKLATLTASATVLADATLQYPDLHRSSATRAINDAIRDGLPPQAVRAAGQRTLKIAEAIAYGAAINRQSAVFPHPEDSETDFNSTVQRLLERGSFGSINGLYEDLDARTSDQWTQSDLLSFSPRDFEELLAICWRDFQNAAVTTQGSQDGGIDLIVRTSGGTRLAVQAKRYQPSNSVGIATVQRTAGLTTEFDIERSVVVTSSSFTRQAKESAAEIDEITIVDGDQLCVWLNKSSLAPPFNPQRS